MLFEIQLSKEQYDTFSYSLLTLPHIVILMLEELNIGSSKFYAHVKLLVAMCNTIWLLKH